MADPKINITDAELEVLKAIWANSGPMSDRQIRDALTAATGWKKGTIQTLTRRLVDKDMLRREQREVFYYHPAVSREEYAKSRTRDLLQQVFGGNAKSMVATLLNNDVLSREELDELQAYWRERQDKDDD